MNRNIFKFIGLAIGLGVLLFLLLILFPRDYDVPEFRERAGTQYWDLPTGSRIGYTLLPGKNDKRKTPIIYLHGGPGGWITDQHIEMLKPLAEDGYDVYLYDQVGSGHSGRLEDIGKYTVVRHKKDLEAIVQKIGSEKVALIGQSWGAMLLSSYLADNCERVAKAIVTGPGPILPIRPALAKIRPPDSLNLREPAVSNREGNWKANNIRSRFMRFVAYAFGKKLASDREADHFFTYLNNELKKSTLCDTALVRESEGGGGYYAHLMTVKSFDTVEDRRAGLKACNTPVLVLRGQCDNQKWGFAQEYLELFPNSRLEVIPGAGHSIWEEQPEQYVRLVRGFLGE